MVVFSGQLTELSLAPHNASLDFPPNLRAWKLVDGNVRGWVDLDGIRNNIRPVGACAWVWTSVPNV